MPRKILLFTAASVVALTAASSQTIEDRLVKAETEINTAENAAGRADTACKQNKQPKCSDEVHTTLLALRRALYTAQKAREAAGGDTTPTPAPSGTSLVIEGDSYSVCWAGNWCGKIKAAHPEWTVSGLAVGGSVLGNPTDANALRNPDRIAKVKAAKPNVIAFLVGANDLVSWNPAWTAQSWLDRLALYIDELKAANPGARIVVGTVMPNASGTTAEEFAKRRPIVNSAIRGWVGTKIDGVIDFAADPVIGPDRAALDPILYQADKLHPSDCNTDGKGGQCYMAKDADPVLVKAMVGTATPPPVADDKVAPTTAGLAPIPSNFDLKLAVRAGTVIPKGQPTVNENKGAFRFICGPGQLSYDDPIVYPGQPGKSHLHQFYGNVTANAHSTFASLRAAGDSTCNYTGKGVAANRSAYWMPAMLDGRGNVVQPEYTQTYYKRSPLGRYECLESKCLGIPNGLRFIFGYDMIAGKASTYPGNYKCEGAGAQVVVTKTIGEQAKYCRPGSHLVAQIDTPKCWDGKNLDTPDHRSHLSDMFFDRNTGKSSCPVDHPYLIPQFTLGVFYLVVEGDDLTKWRLSSDEMHPELPAGSTFHADYFEAWDEGVKRLWEGNCIDKYLNCSAGENGDGSSLVGAASGTTGPWVVPGRLVPLVSIPGPSH